MLTAQDIYAAARTLSLPERLRLAALLLNELEQPAPSQIDLAALAGYSDAWTEEDIQDFKQLCARRFITEGSSEAEQDDALPPLEELLKMKTEQSLEPECI